VIKKCVEDHTINLFVRKAHFKAEKNYAELKNEKRKILIDQLTKISHYI